MTRRTAPMNGMIPTSPVQLTIAEPRQMESCKPGCCKEGSREGRDIGSSHRVSHGIGRQRPLSFSEVYLIDSASAYIRVIAEGFMLYSLGVWGCTPSAFCKRYFTSIVSTCIQRCMIFNIGRAHRTKRGIFCLSSGPVRTMHVVTRYVTYYIHISP
jgi:hypothetical protein